MNKPDTVHSYTKGLDQLGELMSYAERLQDIIERKRDAQATQNTICYFLLTLLVGSALGGIAFAISMNLSFSHPIVLLSAGISLTSIGIAVTWMWMGNSRSESAVEQRILSEVVEMSSSLFRHLEPEQINPVDRQLLALRLRRLSLSGN